MLYGRFNPPLRIVLNNECNGKCSFCHREGNSSQSSMSMEILAECIEAINKLRISDVSLTGGEPTLCKELAQIINSISAQCKDTRLSLTTNGLNLCSIASQIKYTIYGINLSIVSLDLAIAEKYQDVVPTVAIDGLDKFPALNKNLNVMILEHNYQKIDDLIKLCIIKGYNLDIMFLDRTDLEYWNIQKYVLNRLLTIGDACIVLQSTPVMQIKISEKNYIRVKHPLLSRLLQREVCNNCQNDKECFERICAVRVYGNKLVTPCLSNRIQEKPEGSVLEKIEETYNKLSNISRIYKFDL